MPPHVLVLDALRDQAFLKEQRSDPVIKELLRPGDRVVVCAHCQLVFLEDTWTEIRGRFNHGTATLQSLPNTPRPFSRHATPTPRPTPDPVQPSADAGGNEPGGERPRPRPTSRSHVTTESSWTAADVQEPTPVPVTTPETSFTDALTMRELPFQLREIPFAMREIRPF